MASSNPSTPLPPSFLFPVRTITSSGIAKDCTVEAARAAIQDPPTLIRMNPLVESFSQDATDSKLWHIVDVQKFLGISYKFTYSARFQLVADGVDTRTDTALGTKIANRWRVKVGPNGVEIVETVEAQAFVLLMSYVANTIVRSHQSLIDKLIVQLGELNSAPRAVVKTAVEQRHSLGIVSLSVTVLFATAVLSSFSNGKQVSLIVGLCVELLLLGRTAIQRAKDPYGSFHLSLNKSATDTNRNTEPVNEWLNMGYWQDTSQFPHACRALALKLIQAANCTAGGTVLDVGHACGDSLLMHLKDPEVPRPNYLAGITSLPWHHRRAASRLCEAGLQVTTPCEIFLYNGDAVLRDQQSRSHPLSALSRHPKFTSILALDCAYHFDTRSQFLVQCYQRLEDGGTLAITDLCVGTGVNTNQVTLYLLCVGLAIPQVNIWSKERYLEEMRRVGFVDCVCTDVSSFVFPGFRKFLRSKGGAWGVTERLVIGNWERIGGRYIIISGKRRNRGVVAV